MAARLMPKIKYRRRKDKFVATEETQKSQSSYGSKLIYARRKSENYEYLFVGVMVGDWSN